MVPENELLSRRSKDMDVWSGNARRVLSWPSPLKFLSGWCFGISALLVKLTANKEDKKQQRLETASRYCNSVACWFVCALPFKTKLAVFLSLPHVLFCILVGLQACGRWISSTSETATLLAVRKNGAMGSRQRRVNCVKKDFRHHAGEGDSPSTSLGP